jgi:REP element-mobilizing transposase RayT
MVQHRQRPEHRAAFPVHVTLRARRDIPSLRLERTFVPVRTAISRSSHARFRVLHFSIQSDYAHLIVEADTATALSCGIAALKIRVARGINRVLGRRGAVWADRYHARPLRTPREMRAALVYVLQNWKKHIRHVRGLDGRSSAAWFDGWAERPAPPLESSPVVAPRSWLAATGWRRCAVGPLRKDDTPQGAPEGPLI